MLRTILSIAVNICTLYYHLCVFAYYQGKLHSQMQRTNSLP